MEACPRCQGFSERINIASPREYLDLARQLIQIVQQGTFLLVHADCPLEDLFGQVWPGDSLSHDFQCTTCGHGYKLHADTYHGGARWAPMD